MKFWPRKEGFTFNELQKPFPPDKENEFQEWLQRELPSRPDLQGIHIAFQRASFIFGNRPPAFGLAHTMPIERLEGLRFQTAIDNMMAGRALEYRNVRFRKTGLLTITANVQTHPQTLTLSDAKDAFAHAEEVLTELKQASAFRKATRFYRFIFQLVTETDHQSFEPDKVYFQKRGNRVIDIQARDS